MDRAFDRIPGLIRAMERIWKGTTIEHEMTSRREEAALFEAGLAEAWRLSGRNALAHDFAVESGLRRRAFVAQR